MEATNHCIDEAKVLRSLRPCLMFDRASAGKGTSRVSGWINRHCRRLFLCLLIVHNKQIGMETYILCESAKCMSVVSNR
jgi:hypothetical protein